MKKIYVITGATSGIGKALAEHFSKENTVFVGYRNKEKLESLPQNAIPFFIDSNNEKSIESAANFIKSQVNKIDTLINVSGCVVAGAMEHIPPSELRRQFEVNVFAHINFTQQLLSHIDNGKIINISSMSSFGIFPFIAPYAASKRALDIMFNALQLEIKKNITIISIKPGVIATPLWEKSILENEKAFNTCNNYDKEMSFMIKNAKKNANQGLPVEKVVNKIIKIDNLTNPKPSYTIGFDAKIAEIISHLPQQMLNKLIKLKISKRIS